MTVKDLENERQRPISLGALSELTKIDGKVLGGMFAVVFGASETSVRSTCA